MCRVTPVISICGRCPVSGFVNFLYHVMPKSNFANSPPAPSHPTVGCFWKYSDTRFKLPSIRLFLTTTPNVVSPLAPSGYYFAPN